MKDDRRIHSVFIGQAERLRRLVIGMGINAEQAKDVLQEVYLEMLERKPKYLGEKEVACWLMRVAVNKCMLEYRQKRRYAKAVGQAMQQLPQRDTSGLFSPDEQAVCSEEIEAMRLCLDQMDDTLRVVLVMRYYCKMNSTEIGETLKLEPGTVRKRLFTARIKLANTLLQMGIEP